VHRQVWLFLGSFSGQRRYGSGHSASPFTNCHPTPDSPTTKDVIAFSFHYWRLVSTSPCTKNSTDANDLSSVIIVAIYNCVLTVKLFSSPNYTWGLAYELCWMYAELTGCVICASASSLKPFFKRIIPALFSSHGASYGPSGATGGSHAIVNSRRQLSRKQADAIELQSGDDSESGRKVMDDDETKLWPKPKSSFDNSNGNHKVLVSATGESNGVGRSSSRFQRNGKSDGIEIVSTTEVLYSPR
jgi:hypothetical protein